MMRILLAEDDEILGDGLQTSLMAYKHVVDWSKNGATAKHAIDTEVFDVIVLDIGLPNISGLELLKHLRQKPNPNQTAPVLILTAHDAIADRIKGLDAGADDYLVKYCSLDELEARIRALYRRRTGISTNIINRKNISLNLTTSQITVDGIPLILPRRELTIFLFKGWLLANQGCIISRSLWYLLALESMVDLRVLRILMRKTLRSPIDSEARRYQRLRNNITNSLWLG
jgi:two-component system response regulator QseB